MYFKKKAKFFIYHYYFKQKNNKKFDAAIFFPFQWYFECWPIYLPSLPMHLLLLCINLGLTKKKIHKYYLQYIPVFGNGI